MNVRFTLPPAIVILLFQNRNKERRYHMERIILASASPRRRELLAKAGVRFSVLPAEGEEHTDAAEPAQVVEALSASKARETAGRLQGKDPVLVIGADTVVAMDGQILGKPRDEEDAVRMLELLQGRSHHVFTGVTFLYREKEGEELKLHTFHVSTEVCFYPVSRERILDYVKTGEPLDKAGAYGIQGLWGVYVREIHGDYNNVVGLPVARTFFEADRLGISLRG